MTPRGNLHRGVHRATHRGLGQESSREIAVALDKLNESSLKVTVSDVADPCFACALVVTRADYEEMKRAQGLLVEFDAFPAQLVRLLQQCHCGNIFLSLLQDGPSTVHLEIVERNEFKKLVHLSLKMALASDADLKRNMADHIAELKSKISSLEALSSSREAAFKEKERFLGMRIDDLTSLLSKASDDKVHRENEFHHLLKKERDRLDQEREELKKCADAHVKTQIGPVQEALNKKEKQLEDALSRCGILQETIKSLESQINDKTQRMLNVEKQLHSVKMDAETWRNQNGALDRNYHDKEIALQQTRARLNEAEKALKEKSDLLRDTLDSLQSVSREKISWEEKANVNEAISAKKTLEAQSANEQLLKANKIIAKQNSDILGLREKLMCRTAIVLEQEKVINANSTEISELKIMKDELHNEIDNTKKDHSKLMTEMEDIRKQLDEKAEIIKNNNDVIQWLHKKIDALQLVNDITSAAGSTRIPPLNSMRIPHNIADKNSNFDCASDRLSNLYIAGLRDDKTSSNGGFTEPSSNDPQYSLDPVYLKPTNASKTSSRKSQDSKTYPTLPSVGRGIKEKRLQNEAKRKNAKTDFAKLSGNENYYISTGMAAYYPNK